MPKFLEIDPTELQENVFRQIGQQWMLITAGKPGKFNTMTASWGGLGVLWNANVSFVFVRPSRYTYEFMEQEPHYSLSFFGPDRRRALQICGSKSGRDVDKMELTGLTPCFDTPAPRFEEAELTLVCRKLYTQDLDPARFLDPAIAGNYQNDDYHRMYVGEIQKILRRV